MTNLRAFFMLLLFQSAGAILKAVTRSPLPGPLLGMAMLTLWLVLMRKRPHDALDRMADGLLGWLGLLFVPVGVGVVADLAILRAAWVPISVGLTGSTLVTVLVTAWVMSALQSRNAKERAI